MAQDSFQNDMGAHHDVPVLVLSNGNQPSVHDPNQKGWLPVKLASFSMSILLVYAICVYHNPSGMCTLRQAREET